MSLPVLGLSIPPPNGKILVEGGGETIRNLFAKNNSFKLKEGNAMLLTDEVKNALLVPAATTVGKALDALICIL